MANMFTAAEDVAVAMVMKVAAKVVAMTENVEAVATVKANAAAAVIKINL